MKEKFALLTVRPSQTLRNLTKVRSAEIVENILRSEMLIAGSAGTIWNIFILQASVAPGVLS